MLRMYVCERACGSLAWLCDDEISLSYPICINEFKVISIRSLNDFMCYACSSFDEQTGGN